MVLVKSRPGSALAAALSILLQLYMSQHDFSFTVDQSVSDH